MNKHLSRKHADRPNSVGYAVPVRAAPKSNRARGSNRASTMEKKENTEAFDDAFIAAARDYRMLLDKDYPVDASLKLVGDRYRLSHNGRMMLYRGILSLKASQINLAKLIRSPWERASLGVDGYNILFTLMNYMHGHPMFIATDGFLRDVGGAHGRIADHRGFERMAEIAAEYLAALNLESLTFFLDAPVSSSGRQAGFLREAFTQRSMNAEVRLENGVDHFLACWEGELIATADSAIIGRTNAHVFDLARAILENQFEARFISLARLLEPSFSISAQL